MRKIKMGMVGGGTGAFIGEVHRKAAFLDGKIELVCGAFNSDAQRSKHSAKNFGIASLRAYGSYQEMFKKEAQLSSEQRMDFVAIVTPNKTHFPISKLALESGFHVVCDKPATFSLAEAKELQKIVEKTGLIYALTHTYSAYPMIKQAKEMIAEGKLGKIRRVVAEYPQGWLSTNLEAQGQKQALWRTDPEQSGISCCMGDIATHAENLLEYVTSLRITEVSADLTAFVQGRRLDDDGNVLLRLEQGAKGVLFASQIAAGEENALRLRVYGEKGGLEWSHNDPNSLICRWLEEPTQIYRTGVDNAYLSELTQKNTRLPSGHPEGYLEAFANIYVDVATAIHARLNGDSTAKPEVPDIVAGVRAMTFVQAVVESSQKNSTWIKI